MNINTVLRILQRVITISAIALIFCVALAWHYDEPTIPFLLSFVAAAMLVVISFLVSKGTKVVEMGKKEAYVSVSAAWVIISMIGALPYLISGYIPNIIDAYFESVSGYTTTGSSILTDIEALPKSLLFWRSLTHWIGGIGIIVLVIIVSPSLKIGNYNLFTAESSLKDKIRPRMKAMGYRLLTIYLLLTAIEAILLFLGDMTLFDSVCHSFGTVATGGFSTQNASIANYSPYIQYVIIIFMVLAGTNFVIHYYLFLRDVAHIRKNDEFRFYITVILVLGLAVTAVLYFQTPRSLELSFRDSFFQTVSIITCTGFATSDYLLWPKLGTLLVFGMLFIGGSTGSTSGGIKMARHLVALKNIKRLLQKSVHPKGIFTVKLNGNILSEDNNSSLMTFIITYLLVFAIGSILLIITGLDGATSTSAIATAMGGIGPGFGAVGPMSNFYLLPAISKLIITVFMLMGRLEIYSFLLIFTPMFWKK
ncbi:MAG: potassium transporter [Bacteroidetes bacterium HGW-Bacteroidetes-16]|jgi:trk system potassium uptake protein TrkH|nr:MAG: potassium transporter [Bacteroidetes bacterium HGW-Bacteroidetes-16]